MNTHTSNSPLSANPSPTETLPGPAFPAISAATFFSWVTASQRLEEWLRWMPYVCRDRSGTCDLPAFPEFFCGHGELPWPCATLGEDGDDGLISMASEVLIRNDAWILPSIEAAAVPLTILGSDHQILAAPLYEPSTPSAARTWTGRLGLTHVLWALEKGYAASANWAGDWYPRAECLRTRL